MNKPDDSYVGVNKNGEATSFVGKDAVNLYRAATLVSALNLYARSGMKVNRNVSPTRLLALASEYTRKHYKRGQYAEAADDVKKWVETMKAALPVVKDGEEKA